MNVYRRRGNCEIKGSVESGKNGAEWEVRSGGMVVQKRNSDVDQSHGDSVSTIHVRVKYGSSYHQIRIRSQASFGDLRKMLAQPTGLHHQDQKLIFKNKERDSKEFLDLAGVKDGSKISLVEDIVSKEKRNLEMLKNANTANTAKSLSVITHDIDKLTEQLAAMEGTASRGGKIAVTDIENLTEILMTKLIKLDEVVADGDLKLQRKVQVRRVQKHIETLDFLKVQQSMSVPWQQQEHSSRQNHMVLQKPCVAQPSHCERTLQKKAALEKTRRHDKSVVVTTDWETFD